MTIFGIIWIFLIFIALLTKRIEYLIFLTIFSSVFQCSDVLLLNGEGIGPQIVTSIVFVLYYFIETCLKKIKFKRYLTAYQLLALLLFAAAFLSAAVNHEISNASFRLAQLLAYVLCFNCMLSAGHKIHEDFIYRMFRFMTIFLLIVGMLQLAITSGILPRTAVVNELLYNDIVYSGSNVTYFSRDNYFRILSTYMEPSYYAGFIVGAFFYFFHYKEKRQRNYVLLFFIVLEIILTFSSTAYGALLVVGILYILFSGEGKTRIYVLAGGAIAFLIMYFGFYDVLDSVIFSKMESGSGVARSYWNQAGWNAFYSNPVWGTGYKSIRASSLFVTLLAAEGVIGLISYIVFNLKLVFPVLSKKRQMEMGTEHIGICFALLAVIATQMIAVPDLDICSYWMWANLFALSYGKLKGGELK